MSESAIFKAAVKLTPERRDAYLDHTCGANPDLRREVESLLRVHDASGSFLRDPPARPQATVQYPLITEGPGTHIGPYKLLQQLGDGGMGVVYMAEQEQPLRRRVALKIIKPGMDSAQVIARFEVERQALALMDHPNIARVLDAGTTESGRPYFVMELVHGVPITQYCDANKLSPRQRLELFIPVCQAIQHAHQKGIIHRDLKPSNVMVTLHDGQPVPKVIDFGVAKATEQRLTERTLFTQYGTIVGTLEYMAPEQAEMSGLGVDSRSDIYSLGVLLYELLTGTTPLEQSRLRAAAYGEMLRLIREEEPPRPSRRISTSGDRLATISAERSTEPAQLSRLVHGELDWIVMRCLEKDRTRRYEAASSLARDVQRYLADEPVEACPPSAGYRLRKFARKNKRLLVTVASFAALLLLGVAGSTWQAVRATQAETQALAERDEKEHARQAEAEQRNVAQQQRDDAQKQRDEAQRQRDEVKALNEKLAAKEQQLQRTLYTSHINLAQQAWEAGRVGRVVELLEQHHPKAGESDLRGFEWYYLYRLCHTDLLTLEGHVTSIPADRSVAYSPDGKRVASASGGTNAEVKVWDAQTGRLLLTIKADIGELNSVAFSPDGKRLAGGGWLWDDTKKAYSPGEVKLWDAQTGQELLNLKGSATSVVFSPDGKRLAAGSGRHSVAFEPSEVRVWDAQTGQELLNLKHRGGVFTVAFSPDGKRLASGDANGTVKVWDAQTGQELLSLNGRPVHSVVFSPDGKRLVSASGGRDEVRVWDAQTGQQLLSLPGSDGAAHSVAFSPDGKRLAGASDRGVRVWDAQTGKELLTFRGHTGPVTSVVFSPDGTRLASGATDGTVKIWDATTNPEAPTFSARNVRGVVFSPDGKRLAGGAYDETVKAPAVKVWDAQTGQELLSLNGHTSNVSSVAFSPDGQRLVSGSGTYDATKKAWVAGEVKLWDAQTGQELLTFKGHTAPAHSVAFSPDGKRLASGSGDRRNPSSPPAGEVKVWDAQTGQELLSLKGGGPSVVYSPDGKRLASASGEGVKVWDAQTGQEILTLKVRTGGAVAFSPDGKRLASSSYLRPGFGEIKVWDAQTGQELLALKGHTDLVFSVIFSPDGRRLAASLGGWTPSGEVKMWDAQTGQELLTFKGGGHNSSVAFSPDGHRLVSEAGGGTVTIYDATPLPEKP